MINYHCPDFCRGFDVYQILLHFKKYYPQCFNENVNIASIFGSFPSMTWNGGTTDCLDSKLNLNAMEHMVNTYRDQNIPIKLTLTNPLLEKEDCYDRYCNAVLRICENDINEILVSSPILENYLRDKYPSYKINRSIIATAKNETLDDYLALLQQYNKVVLPKRLSKDREFLLSIPKEYRARFEILCSDHCKYECPRLYTHYKDYAKAQLFLEDNPEKFPCSSKFDSPFIEYESRNTQIFYPEIKNWYEPNNFTELKLSGRMNIVKIITVAIEYLIKPEYHYDMYTILLEAVFCN